ncbi:MAG: CHAD domain-containing protein [Mucilaginibacter sp.]
MKKKNGVRYFEQEWKGMCAHLKSYLKTEEDEELHQFRVKIKKLKAFMILSDSANPHPALLKQFKPIKKIFKQAGVLRDAYLNLEFIKLFQPDNATAQEILIKNATLKFKSNGDKYLRKINKVHPPLKKEIKSIKDSSINHFYNDRLLQIAQILTLCQFDEQLHECRKLIKILLYNYKPARESLNVRLDEDYLERLQQTIGDWHDQVLSITRLREDMVPETMLTEAMNEKVAKLKEDIIGLKQDFYSRVIIAAD